MNMRVTGAGLRGGAGMVQPAAGPSGRNLAAGMPVPAAAGPEADGQMPGEMDEAIAAVMEAAAAQGFAMPEGVSQEQMPQVYQQMLAAAAKSDMGATDGGIAMIERLAQTLGVPSPFGAQDQGAPDYVFGGEEPQPLSRAPQPPRGAGPRY